MNYICLKKACTGEFQSHPRTEDAQGCRIRRYISPRKEHNDFKPLSSSILNGANRLSRKPGGKAGMSGKFVEKSSFPSISVMSCLRCCSSLWGMKEHGRTGMHSLSPRTHTYPLIQAVLGQTCPSAPPAALSSRGC